MVHTIAKHSAERGHQVPKVGTRVWLSETSRGYVTSSRGGGGGMDVLCMGEDFRQGVVQYKKLYCEVDGCKQKSRVGLNGPFAQRVNGGVSEVCFQHYVSNIKKKVHDKGSEVLLMIESEMHPEVKREVDLAMQDMRVSARNYEQNVYFEEEKGAKRGNKKRNQRIVVETFLEGENDAAWEQAIAKEVTKKVFSCKGLRVKFKDDLGTIVNEELDYNGNLMKVFVFFDKDVDSVKNKVKNWMSYVWNNTTSKEFVASDDNISLVECQGCVSRQMGKESVCVGACPRFATNSIYKHTPEVISWLEENKESIFAKKSASTIHCCHFCNEHWMEIYNMMGDKAEKFKSMTVGEMNANWLANEGLLSRGWNYMWGKNPSIIQDKIHWPIRLENNKTLSDMDMDEDPWKVNTRVMMMPLQSNMMGTVVSVDPGPQNTLSVSYMITVKPDNVTSNLPKVPVSTESFKNEKYVALKCFCKMDKDLPYRIHYSTNTINPEMMVNYKGSKIQFIEYMKTNPEVSEYLEPNFKSSGWIHFCDYHWNFVKNALRYDDEKASQNLGGQTIGNKQDIGLWKKLGYLPAIASVGLSVAFPVFEFGSWSSMALYMGKEMAGMIGGAMLAPNKNSALRNVGVHTASKVGMAIGLDYIKPAEPLLKEATKELLSDPSKFYLPSAAPTLLSGAFIVGNLIAQYYSNKNKREMYSTSGLDPTVVEAKMQEAEAAVSHEYVQVATLPFFKFIPAEQMEKLSKLYFAVLHTQPKGTATVATPNGADLAERLLHMETAMCGMTFAGDSFNGLAGAISEWDNHPTNEAIFAGVFLRKNVPFPTFVFNGYYGFSKYTLQNVAFDQGDPEMVKDLEKLHKVATSNVGYMAFSVNDGRLFKSNDQNDYTLNHWKYTDNPKDALLVQAEFFKSIEFRITMAKTSEVTRMLLEKNKNALLPIEQFWYFPGLSMKTGNERSLGTTVLRDLAKSVLANQAVAFCTDGTVFESVTEMQNWELKFDQFSRGLYIKRTVPLAYNGYNFLDEDLLHVGGFGNDNFRREFEKKFGPIPWRFSVGYPFSEKEDSFQQYAVSMDERKAQHLLTIKYEESVAADIGITVQESTMDSLKSSLLGAEQRQPSSPRSLAASFNPSNFPLKSIENSVGSMCNDVHSILANKKRTIPEERKKKLESLYQRFQSAAEAIKEAEEVWNDTLNEFEEERTRLEDIKQRLSTTVTSIVAELNQSHSSLESMTRGILNDNFSVSQKTKKKSSFFNDNEGDDDNEDDSSSSSKIVIKDIINFSNNFLRRYLEAKRISDMVVFGFTSGVIVVKNKKYTPRDSVNLVAMVSEKSSEKSDSSVDAVMILDHVERTVEFVKNLQSGVSDSKWQNWWYNEGKSLFKAQSYEFLQEFPPMAHSCSVLPAIGSEDLSRLAHIYYLYNRAESNAKGAQATEIRKSLSTSLGSRDQCLIFPAFINDIRELIL